MKTIPAPCHKSYILFQQWAPGKIEIGFTSLNSWLWVSRSLLREWFPRQRRCRMLTLAAARSASYCLWVKRGSWCTEFLVARSRSRLLTCASSAQKRSSVQGRILKDDSQRRCSFPGVGPLFCWQHAVQSAQELWSHNENWQNRTEKDQDGEAQRNELWA